MSLRRLFYPALLLPASLALVPGVLAQAPLSPDSGAQRQLDWVPRSALPEDLAAACPRGCEGGYLQPPRQDPAQLLNPAHSELNAEAGQAELDGESGIAHLSNRVIFTQGWREVAADEVIIDRNTHLYQLQGNITLREPNLLLTGISATLHAATNELQLSGAHYLLHDLRVQGSAEQMRRAADGRIYIDNATYSTCEPMNQDWLFVAEQLEIDPQAGRILARNMTIKAGPVTLFYAPRMSFPLGDRRKSGLLYPIIESSGDNGIDYAQPIYLNLAPNYDLSLTPRLIERRGAMLESEFRWLHEGGAGNLQGAWLSNDGGGERNIHAGENRWFGRLQADRAQWGGALELDYSAVSDIDYFSDLGNASLASSSQTWLNRRVHYARQGRQLDFSLTALSYQDLTRNELRGFEELPRMQLSGQWLHGSHWYQDTDLEWVAFSPLQNRVTPESPLQTDVAGSWIDGARLRLDYRAGWRYQNPGAFFDLGLLAGYRQYQLDQALQSHTDRTPDFHATGLVLDSGLIFERNPRGSGWSQSLEPRLQYVRIQADAQNHVPLFDTLAPRLTYQTLFRPNPFQGGDRIGDANRLTLGLETALQSGDTGRELLRVGIAQQFYFEDREVHASPQLAAGLVDPENYAANDPRQLAALRGALELESLQAARSGLQGYMQWQASPRWYGRMLLDWSEQSHELEYGTVELGYRAPDSRSLVNLAYHYGRNSPVFRDANGNQLVEAGEIVAGDIEQLDFSAVLEFAEHWTLFGKWQQDVVHLRPLEIMAGARYDACCWSTSLMWRRWLERDENQLLPEQALIHDNGIFVSFELKGLAGVGERLNNILSGGIPGY